MGLPPATSPLGLALGGSLLLHVGMLFGVPAPAPATPGVARPLSVHLITAAQATTPSVTQAAPAAHARHPDRAHLQLTARKHASMPPQATSSRAESVPDTALPETAQQATAANNEPAISTTTYYEGTQLDAPPHLLGEVQQVYPARARTADIEGSVTLSLLINEHGEVDDASVISAQPPGYFEQAALNMLRRQRFTPALIHNQPVKSRWHTVVRYRLQS